MASNLETSVPRRPVSVQTPPLARVPKPWGEELILQRTAATVVKALRINPHKRLSLQFHRHKHETIMLLSGSALLSLGAEIDQLNDFRLRTGAEQQILPGQIHRLSAGASGADILEVASRPPHNPKQS